MTVEVLKTNYEDLPMRSGIEQKDRKMLAELMGQALASTYVLYHKTHAFHWNVTGPLFYSVHKLTDDQYQDLAASIDDIAERIRAIGAKAPTGLKSYIGLSRIDDNTDVEDAVEMIAQLAKDHQEVASQFRDAVKEADRVEDVFTADLLTARIGAHEEAAWMLNSLITQ